MQNLIVISGTAALRKSHSEHSERVYELLFGEMVQFVEECKQWVRVSVLGNVDGWVQRDSLIEVSEEFAKGYTVEHRVTSRIAIVKRKNQFETEIVPALSVLPYLDVNLNEFQMGDFRYEICSPYSLSKSVSNSTDIFNLVLNYLNAPFVWRGRSPYGIDDVEFVRAVLTLFIPEPPRNLDGLAHYGVALSFIEEAEIGDILLFQDAVGNLNHAGIYLGSGKVIHASGRVKIDRVDHQGIFNDTIKRYSHLLALIVSHS